MPESLEISRHIPAPPKAVFEAWLDAKRHAAFTGGAATAGRRGEFTAWDGYITGRTLRKVAHKLIVQSWRTTEFPDGAPDSQLELALAPANGGTRLTLRHSEIPDGQGPSYLSGWDEFYFDPMVAYFAARSAKPARKKAPAKKAAPKRSAPAKKRRRRC